MPEPSFGSAPNAMTPMTLEPSPFASSADTPSGPAAGYFLPGNPLPYLAPSATHQPELLLLSWMIATLNTIVTDIQNHPIVSDPIPYPSSFTDQQAYRLYLQLRNNLRHLGTVNSDLCRGIRLLQFLPGSPGSPGHYRMDPSARFPPSATRNFLFTQPLQPLSNPTPPSPQHRLITHLAPRNRSRSRDRQLASNTTASPHNPNLHISSRQPLSDITPSPDHRSQLHQSLWTATTTPPHTSSSTPSASWTMPSQRDRTGQPY